MLGTQNRQVLSSLSSAPGMKSKDSVAQVAKLETPGVQLETDSREWFREQICDLKQWGLKHCLGEGNKTAIPSM